MKKSVFLLGLAVFCMLCSTANALYSVSEKGEWPKSWPKELEPLREQARTLVGPIALNQHFAIRFKNREEFEAAWPHILEVKSKGTPIFLIRGENFFLGEKNKAGVVIHSPPRNQVGAAEIPIAGVTNPRTKWMNATFIELVVDGDIVDLNRISLPEDTPIVDERFKDAKKK